MPAIDASQAGKAARPARPWPEWLNVRLPARRWRLSDLMVLVALTAIQLTALTWIARAAMPHSETLFLLALTLACPVLFAAAWFLSGAELGPRSRWMEIPIAALFVLTAFLLIAIVAGVTVISPAGGFWIGATLLALLIYLTTWS